ncbi:MAG: glycosyltransferase family 39 protein [Anaerolineae bacterium]|nr:glycosyltransferase family 39 protein [Anaerolineae bacterium]
MSAFPIPGGLSRMHAHIRLLLLLTLLVRGGMFLAYPLQVRVDDNQNGQRYLIDRLLEGDLLIGNVRYNTGYPLVIAPAAAAGQLFGRLNERFVLLVQVTLSALIPFLLYDLARRHHSRRAGLVVALLALFDPHGLQWAHLSLPIWLVALCYTLSIWIMDRATQRGLPRGPFLVAGVILGVAVLARLVFAPVVALITLTLLFSRRFSMRKRLNALVALGVGSLLVLASYFVLVHYPATGTFRLSCVGGHNFLESLYEADIPVVAANGEATARLLNLSALPANSRPETSLGYGDWRNPGPWVTQEVQREFLSQLPPEVVPETIDMRPANDVLTWNLGPCETDSLLYAVALEALAARPLQFVVSLPGEVHVLLHRITRWHLPHIDSLEIYDDSDLPFPLQRARDRQGLSYLRNPLWPAPMAVYSDTRDLLNWTNLLIVPALAWALLRGRALFVLAALTLLFWVIFLAVFDWREGRIVAPLWPLWPLLIGGMLADLWQGISAWAGARRESARPSR